MSRYLLVVLAWAVPASSLAWDAVGPVPGPLDEIGDVEVAWRAGGAREVFDGTLHPVRWHPIDAAAREGRLDLRRVVYLRGPGVVYVRGVFSTSVPAPWVAWVHSAGSWRLHLDGERVGGGLGVVPESAPDAVVRWLAPGAHRWLLEIEARPDRSMLSLRWVGLSPPKTGAPVALPGAAPTPWPSPAVRWRQLRRLDTTAARAELARFEAARGLPVRALRVHRGPAPPPPGPDPANPERPEPWLALGDRRCEADDVPGAIAAWRRALTYDPSLDDVRVALAVLERPGLAPLTAARPRPGRCVPARRPELLSPPVGTLDREVVELRHNGVALRLRERITRASDATIPSGVTVLRAQVLTDDGPIPCDRVCARTGGERVHLAWLSREPVDGAVGAVVPVASEHPVDRWVYEVRLPAGWPLSWDGRGLEGPDARRAGDVESWTWSARDIPGRHHLAGAPELVAGDAYLAYGSFTDWGAFGAWARVRLGPAAGGWLLVRSPRLGWLPDVPAPGAFDVVLRADVTVPPDALGGEAVKIHEDGRLERLRVEGIPPWLERRADLRRVDEALTLLPDAGGPRPVSGASPPVRALARHARTGRRSRPLVVAPERSRWTLVVDAASGRAPPDARVVSEFGVYTRRTRQVGSGYEVVRTLELKGGALAATRYGAFRSFLTEVDRADASGWAW